MNMERFKLEEKIKILNLKYRGDAVRISEETGLDLVFIKKTVAKFKKKEQRDVNVLIANTFAFHLMSGYQQRVAHITEMLNELNTNRFTGLTSDIINTKIDLIKQLRDEDVCLVNFMEKMGYTGNGEQPQPIYNKHNYLVINNNGNKKNGYSDVDPDVAKDIQKLTPVENQKLINRLESELELTEENV